MRPEPSKVPPRGECRDFTRYMHWIETTGLRKHACKHGRDMHSDIECGDHKQDRRSEPR